MIFPVLKDLGAPVEKRVIEFKGYDVQNVIDPGAMRDMRNLSSDEYPSIYQRKKRGIYPTKYTNPTAILPRKEKLAVCDETSFWYDGERIFDLDSEYSGERQMQAINTRIVIFPDKMFYNTETGDYGKLNNIVEVSSVAFHKDATTQETICTFTFEEGKSLAGFSKGDTVNFEGTSLSIVGYKNGQNNDIKHGLIERIDYDENQIWFAYGVINYPTEDEEDFTDSGESGAGFTIEKEVPDLDFILEYGNRLYGTNENTIYVSKLGDPTNWFFYGTGTAESSYTVEVGTDGEFTGIAATPTHIVFFKENCIHKLYGYKPANYQLVTTNCMGLEEGSHKSIQLINGVIFFKSREGIMTYDGNIPINISKEFGKARYDSAAAGTDGIKYYVSMRNKADNKWYLFVYDLEKDIWHLEDNTHAISFAYLKNDLIYCDKDKGQLVSALGIGGIIESEPIEWYAKFGDYDEFIENRKVYSKIEMRLEMEENSHLEVWISVDDGAWESVQRVDTHLKRTVEMPIVPRRCNRFAILLTGTGYVKIESMVRVVREGTMK